MFVFFQKITTLLISVITVIETLIFFWFYGRPSCGYCCYDYCDTVMMFSDVLTEICIFCANEKRLDRCIDIKGICYYVYCLSCRKIYYHCNNCSKFSLSFYYTTPSLATIVCRHCKWYRCHFF